MTQPLLFGVDVAKAELVIASDGGPPITLANSPAEIRRWLRRQPGLVVLGMEATGDYHRTLADSAVAAGHRVHVLSPRALKHYRQAVSQRAKTDRCDAELILRFLEREQSQLRAYVPLSPEHLRWKTLLRRRARLVTVRGTVRQSLAGVPELRADLKGLVQRIDRVIARIEQALEAIIHADAQRTQHRYALQSIVGVGPLTSMGLLSALETGEFITADAFVAYLGLDPRPHDSGGAKGVRRLSKQGDGELRRLLFVAALAASRTKLWKPVYLHHRKRWSPIEVCIILARKIARIAWAIFRHGGQFNPELVHAPA